MKQAHLYLLFRHHGGPMLRNISMRFMVMLHATTTISMLNTVSRTWTHKEIIFSIVYLLNRICQMNFGHSIHIDFTKAYEVRDYPIHVDFAKIDLTLAKYFKLRLFVIFHDRFHQNL